MHMIQISDELFFKLCRYHLLPDTLDDDEAADLSYEIAESLRAKADAMERRRLYSEYKRAADPRKEEAARQAYLDARGVPDAFRWVEEQGKQQ